MEKLNVNILIKDAKERLTGKEVIRLAAIHAGVTVAAGLVVTLLQVVLSEGIGNTGGLSGMGTRSILETLQTALTWANSLLLPFWNLGFLYACLQWARGNTPKTGDLLTGFHRIGPCVGLLLNRMMLAFLVVMLCANVSSFLYMMTPAAAQFTEMTASAGGDVDAVYAFLETMTEAQMLQLMEMILPALVICGVLSAVILIPLMYRFRLAEYAILNHPGVRAMPAMFISVALLRRRCWQLFRLDLKLWWYYLLKTLCLVLFYGELLLAALGVALPVGDKGVSLLIYVIYLAALFAVETLCRPKVETAYALFYEAVMEKGPVQKAQTAKPQNVPWEEQ